MLPGWIKPRALIRRQAAKLLVRVDRDQSAESIERLERWRALDPRHADALRKAEAVFNTARLLDPSPGLFEPKRRSARQHLPSSKLALAASIAAAVIFVPTLLVIERERSAIPLQAMMLSTAVGEIRKVPLEDGSTLTLDTASSVRVNLARSARTAIVERGRVRLSVRKRNVPFMVRIGGTAVRLDEGTVDISQIGGQTHLDLISGSAQVSAPDGVAKPQVIQAPVSVYHPATAQQQIYAARQPRVDWTSGRLSFDGARLAEVAAAANRYSSRHILISDPVVGNLRVTGVYKAGDAAGLAQALAAAFHLRMESDGAGNLRLEQSSGKRAPN